MLIKVDDWRVVSVGCGPLGQQREPLGDAGERLVVKPSSSFGDAEVVILGAPGHPEIGTGLDGFHRVIKAALRRAERCSSDPICATRTPRDPEDFLHGAACHCCAMGSETSCERANRFLDRRFVINLPGSQLGFFQ